MTVVQRNWHRLLTPCTALLLGLWLNTVSAEDTGISFQEFAIHTGDTPQTLVSDIRLTYQLSDYLREGLLNGMTLENELSFTIEWHNSWWLNSQKRLSSVKSELTYHSLSKQYQVVRQDTNETWNFPTLIAALEQMGKLEDYTLPALPDSAYHSDAAIFATAKLTPKSLYLPLKIQALFSDRYALESEGVMWPIP